MTGPIRIAIIVPRLEQLGPVKCMKTLTGGLSKLNDLTIKVFYLDKSDDTDVHMPVPVERLSRRKFRFSDYDIIHTNGIRPDFFAFINRKKIRCHISTIHNAVFEDLEFTYNHITAVVFGHIWLYLWKRADKLVCVSKSLKEYYSGWFPAEKLVHIYNGISEPQPGFTPDREIVDRIDEFRSKGYKIAGSAGILNRRKGTELLIMLAADIKDLVVVVFGDGRELKNLKKLAGKLNVDSRVLFCGFRSNAPAYFMYFDYFIMPSRSEGFGLALVEAVQQKVPVVCSDIPVFRELFSPDEVTFFNPDNSGHLTGAFMAALSTGEKRVEPAYLKYLDRYTAGQMAANYHELYLSAFQAASN